MDTYFDLKATGWRLPTKKELETLNDNMDAIGGFAPTAYWSYDGYNHKQAWTRSFKDGHDSPTLYFFKSRARYVQSIDWKDLTGKGIEKDTPIGTQFDLKNEKVVFAGIDGRDNALIAALADELGPDGNFEVEWNKANEIANEKNKVESLDICKIFASVSAANAALKKISAELETTQQTIADLASKLQKQFNLQDQETKEETEEAETKEA